jgi:hypothetical protein
MWEAYNEFLFEKPTFNYGLILKSDLGCYHGKKVEIITLLKLLHCQNYHGFFIKNKVKLSSCHVA